LQTLRRNARSVAWQQAYKTAIGTGAGRDRFQSIDNALLFALGSYQPPPYPGRVVFFRSVDRIVPGQPVDWGWGRLARDGIETHVVPGDHISMFEEPNVATIVQHLAPHLGPPRA
jgi:thioesterase domain-containing protein